jgi:HK97 family phage major capsid protein
MFVEKSQEEIDNMTPKEFEAYLVAKKEHEAGVRKQEITEAIDALKKENAEANKELIAKHETELNTLKSNLEEFALRLKSMTEKAVVGTGNDNTLRGSLSKAFEAVKEQLKNAIGGKQTEAIKVAVTMQVDNTIGAGDTQVTITDNTNIISPIRKRELRYMSFVSVGRTDGNRALWIEELDEQGTPIMLGEGDTKTKLSVRYEEKTANVKKIAVYGKVTTEMMADLPQLISYIENNLMKRMDIVLENQLFNGDNIGDNLNGAFTLATAFSAGDLAATIPTPNDYDVIGAVALQTELAFGIPNGIFVNPTIVTRMKLTKGEDGHYVMPTFATANGLEVSGMRVIPTTAVSGENFIGGDLSVLQVLIREELGIQIGVDGNDFINNKKTMLLEKRLVQFASANDVACLIKGAFDTAKAALELSTSVPA